LPLELRCPINQLCDDFMWMKKRKWKIVEGNNGIGEAAVVGQGGSFGGRA
jgi:hypothetical protein